MRCSTNLEPTKRSSTVILIKPSSLLSLRFCHRCNCAKYTFPLGPSFYSSCGLIPFQWRWMWTLRWWGRITYSNLQTCFSDLIDCQQFSLLVVSTLLLHVPLVYWFTTKFVPTEVIWAKSWSITTANWRVQPLSGESTPGIWSKLLKKKKESIFENPFQLTILITIFHTPSDWYLLYLIIDQISRIIYQNPQKILVFLEVPTGLSSPSKSCLFFLSICGKKLCALSVVFNLGGNIRFVAIRLEYPRSKGWSHFSPSVQYREKWWKMINHGMGSRIWRQPHFLACFRTFRLHLEL